MSTTGVVLGFHLRVAPEMQPSLSAELREMHLLTRATVPLSVDDDIWSSCDVPARLQQAFCGHASNGLEFYSELKRPVTHRSGQMILAITGERGCADILFERHKICPPSVSVEDLRSEGFTFMGYDVADHWLCSGLMNCGYMPGEKETRAARFSGSLNQHGLFDAAIPAADFRLDCDRRVSSHAPFIVYGLWGL